MGEVDVLWLEIKLRSLGQLRLFIVQTTRKKAKMSGQFGLALWLFAALLVVVDCRPPSRSQQPPHTPEVNSHNAAGSKSNDSADWDLGVPYNRYLKEVVQVLEGDAEFRKKLENSDVDKIRDGSIAHELNFVNQLAIKKA